MPPYRLPLYEAIGERVSELVVLVSTDVEENRSWLPVRGRLDVRPQRTLTFRRPWRHPSGFADATYVHLPIDTVAQLRRLRPDVVISAELGIRSLLSALYCGPRGAPPLVLWATLSERTEQGRGRLRHVLRRRLLRRADAVVVNGASGERYVRSFGVAAERIYRVPYVAALPPHDPGAPSPGPLRRLLYVGQLTERKNLLGVLPQLTAWARDNPETPLELTVVGSGPLAHELAGCLPTGRLSVSVVGERAPDELPSFLQAADALLFPTLADEWGLVVNEALAAGVPVLGSVHSQAVEELVTEGLTGWTFDPEDDRSTRAALDRALSTTPAELAGLRERARERVASLTPERAADDVATMLRALLGGGGSVERRPPSH